MGGRDRIYTLQDVPSTAFDVCCRCRIFRWKAPNTNIPNYDELWKLFHLSKIIFLKSNISRRQSAHKPSISDSTIPIVSRARLRLPPSLQIVPLPPSFLIHFMFHLILRRKWPWPLKFPLGFIIRNLKARSRSPITDSLTKVQDDASTETSFCAHAFAKCSDVHPMPMFAFCPRFRALAFHFLLLLSFILCFIWY